MDDGTVEEIWINSPSRVPQNPKTPTNWKYKKIMNYNKSAKKIKIWKIHSIRIQKMKKINLIDNRSYLIKNKDWIDSPSLSTWSLYRNVKEAI